MSLLKNSIRFYSMTSLQERQEKVAKAKKRLAAVTFLKNISLDGTYTDTSWQLDYPQINVSDKERNAHTTKVTIHPQQSSTSNSNTSKNEQKSHTANDNESVFPPDENDHEGFEAKVNSGRKRSSTCEGVVYVAQRRKHNNRHEKENKGGGKRAHFNSNESLDHGLRERCMSNSNVSNVSDESSSSEKGEIKFVNMRQIPAPDISDQRLVILVSKRSPVLIFSTIPYRKANQRLPIRFSKRRKRISLHLASLEALPSEILPLSRRTRNISGSRPISIDPDPLEQLIQNQEEVSYGHLLDSTQEKHTTDPILIALGETPPPQEFIRHYSRLMTFDKVPSSNIPPPSEGDSNDSHSHSHQNSNYSPYLLDDPEFRGGRHRTLLTFPGYITSVIDYCKASDMKKELNDKFRERFPHIQLTLSKLRSLKRDMRKVKSECNIDLLTVANAYVYFEKLILGTYVNKYNRKLAAGACVLLAAKLNDIKGEILHLLIEKIESIFRVSRQELLAFEFAVLIALGFSLHSPTAEIYPHYQRLLYES